MESRNIKTFNRIFILIGILMLLSGLISCKKDLHVEPDLDHTGDYLILNWNSNRLAVDSAQCFLYTATGKVLEIYEPDHLGSQAWTYKILNPDGSIFRRIMITEGSILTGRYDLITEKWVETRWQTMKRN